MSATANPNPLLLDRRAPRARWPILARSLRDRRRSLIAWSSGIGVYVGLIVATWPSIRGSSEIAKAIENYPDAMKEFFGGAAAFDYTTGGGFLNTQLFSLVLPLLLTIVAIAFGASALAGEHRASQLDLELALPLARPRIVTENVGALAAIVGMVTFVGASVIIGIGALVDLGVAPTDVVAASTGAGLVALLHGLLALDIGSGTGSRGLALGVSTAAFVAGYLIEALSGLVDAVRPLRWMSPLHHANGTIPINNGFPLWHDLLLLGVSVALAAAAVALFARRDVT